MIAIYDATGKIIKTERKFVKNQVIIDPKKPFDISQNDSNQIVSHDVELKKPLQISFTLAQNVPLVCQ